jgi:hypothetical protein
MKLNPARDSQAITPFDALLIQDSFRAIQQQSGPAAERFFRELFSYDVTLKQRFAPDRWRREEVLMDTLRGVVEHINSPEGVGAGLVRVAREYPTYGLSSYHHLYFGAALFSMLEVILGTRFKLVYGAWFKLFQLAVAEVKTDAKRMGANAVGRIEPKYAHPTAA